MLVWFLPMYTNGSFSVERLNGNFRYSLVLVSEDESPLIIKDIGKDYGDQYSIIIKSKFGNINEQAPLPPRNEVSTFFKPPRPTKPLPPPPLPIRDFDYGAPTNQFREESSSIPLPPPQPEIRNEEQIRPPLPPRPISPGKKREDIDVISPREQLLKQIREGNLNLKPTPPPSPKTKPKLISESGENEDYGELSSRDKLLQQIREGNVKLKKSPPPSPKSKQPRPKTGKEKLEEQLEQKIREKLDQIQKANRTEEYESDFE